MPFCKCGKGQGSVIYAQWQFVIPERSRLCRKHLAQVCYCQNVKVTIATSGAVLPLSKGQGHASNRYCQYVIVKRSRSHFSDNWYQFVIVIRSRSNQRQQVPVCTVKRSRSHLSDNRCQFVVVIKSASHVHLLSVTISASLVFSSFWAFCCFICGRRRLTVTPHRLICLVCYFRKVKVTLATLGASLSLQKDQGQITTTWCCLWCRQVRLMSATPSASSSFHKGQDRFGDTGCQLVIGEKSKSSYQHIWGRLWCRKVTVTSLTPDASLSV